MHTRFIRMKWRRMGTAVLLAASLAACSKAPEPVKPPMPSPAPTPAPTVPAPQVSTPPAASTMTAAPAAARPSKHAAEPALSSMMVARANSKMGVAVDLRYQFDGAAVAGQPVTLHLAAVPRVAVSNLSVSIKPVAGVTAGASDMRAEKATP